MGISQETSKMKIKKYKYRGEFLRLPEIMKMAGCKEKYQTIYSRLKRGKALRTALFKPVVKRKFEPSDEWLKMGD